MKRLYQNKEWLIEHYCNKEWSQRVIAQFCDTTQSTISKWIIRHDIESRSFSQGKYGSKNGSWIDSPFRDSNTLYRLYVTEQKSIPQISKDSGHSNSTISRWLSVAEIEIRSGKDAFVKPRTNENNSNWKGGVEIICSVCGKEKSRAAERCQSCYHSERREALQQRLENNELIVPISGTLRSLIKPWKHQILERDSYKCVSCGTMNKLYAHHIVPFYIIRDQLIMEYGGAINYDFSTAEKRQQFLNLVENDKRLWDTDNGVTLCTECHKGEHKRMKASIDEALYTFYATVIGNYDGDTVSVEIDLGFGLTFDTEVRLYGVNTPELKSSDIYKRGKAISAKNAIEVLCVPGRQIIIQTYKSGKYGRWLGILMLDHAIINDFLLETDLAEPYVL